MTSRLLALFLLLAPAGAFAAGPTLPAFPKKDPEVALPEMKVYQVDHHPWRRAIEDLSGARQRLQDDPEWKDWLERDRNEVDAWIKRHQDHVEWQCGWFHDFVSPKDGSHLTWTEEVPGVDVPFLHSPSDPKVPLTAKLFQAWVFDFRCKHADMMREAARLYVLTGEERYAEWAASQLDFYSDHLNEWKDQRDGSRLYWQSLDVAVEGIVYADTVRLLGSYVKPERKAKWKAQFFDPQMKLLSEKFLLIHNIANWHRCAEACVALVFDDQALWKEAMDSPFGFRAQMSQGITSDYLWCEQSFGYNNYVVQACATLYTMADLYDRADELVPEMAASENLMLAPVYLRFPNGNLPNPADSGNTEVVPDRKFFASVYRVFPTTFGLEEAQGKHSWNELVDPPARPDKPAVLPPVKSTDYPSSLMAVMKAGPWQVYLHYGQWTASHAQSEVLNYEATFNGIDITHDPGTVGYGSPMHKGYYTRGLNANVPLVDGEGEGPVPQRGSLQFFQQNPAALAARVATYQGPTKSSATREFSFDGSTFMDRASVTTKDSMTHALGLALSLQGKAEISKDWSADPDFAKGRPDSFTYWKDVKKVDAIDAIRVIVDFGTTKMEVIFETKGPFTLWHATSPDHPPKKRESFYLEKQGKNAVFTTLIAPVPPPEPQKPAAPKPAATAAPKAASAAPAGAAPTPAASGTQSLPPLKPAGT